MTRDTARRGLRTLFQVTVVTAVMQVLVAFGVPLNAQQQAAITALATTLFAVAQNFLEDAGAIPTVGK